MQLDTATPTYFWTLDSKPDNIGVFAPLKAVYRDQAERLYQGGTNTVDKEHFTSLYNFARQRAFTKKNITAAWAACGLFPFKLDRVLRAISKAHARPIVPQSNKIKVGSHLQEAVQTPMTPVSAEALTSLHNLIK